MDLTVNEAAKRTIADATGGFAGLVAAGTATPGGGSVAAYCGLLSASLGRMMCNLTIGKKKYAPVEERARRIESDLDAIGGSLRRLIDEDAESFEAVMAAYRLPKQSDEEKAVRDRRIQDSSKQAVEVPLHTAERSMEVLRLLAELAVIGNSNALPDVSMGSQLALASINGAYYNIIVNLATCSDAVFASRIRELMAELLEEASLLARSVEGELLRKAGGQSSI